MVKHTKRGWKFENTVPTFRTKKEAEAYGKTVQASLEKYGKVEPEGKVETEEAKAAPVEEKPKKEEKAPKEKKEVKEEGKEVKE